MPEEHIFIPMPGSTAMQCSCGKTFATASEQNQHRQWHMDLSHNADIVAVLEGLFPEYTVVDNPTYSFIISKKQLDEVIKKHEV